MTILNSKSDIDAYCIPVIIFYIFIYKTESLVRITTTIFNLKN